MPGKRAIHSSQLLSGLAFCGNCGQHLICRWGTSKVKKRRYAYYACSKKKNGRVKSCNSKYINRENLDNAVIELVIDHALSPSRIYSALEKLRSSFKVTVKDERSKLLKLHNESAKLEERIEVLFDRIGEDGRDEYYLKHLDKKKARHRIVSKEIETLEHRLKLPLKKVGIHHISAFCDHMRNQLHDDKSPIRKQMVQMIIEKVVLNPEKVAVEGSDFELAAIAANWSTANPQRVVRRDVSNWWS